MVKVKEKGNAEFDRSLEVKQLQHLINKIEERVQALETESLKDKDKIKARKFIQEKLINKIANEFWHRMSGQLKHEHFFFQFLHQFIFVADS